MYIVCKVVEVRLVRVTTPSYMGKLDDVLGIGGLGGSVFEGHFLTKRSILEINIPRDLCVGLFSDDQSMAPYSDR